MGKWNKRLAYVYRIWIFSPITLNHRKLILLSKPWNQNRTFQISYLVHIKRVQRSTSIQHTINYRTLAFIYLVAITRASKPHNIQLKHSFLQFLLFNIVSVCAESSCFLKHWQQSSFFVFFFLLIKRDEWRKKLRRIICDARK